MRNLHKINILVVFFLGSCFAFADVKYYESGLGRDWELVGVPKIRQAESEAIAQFFKTYFPLSSDARGHQGQWKIRKSEIDKTHRHNNYHYYYKGRRVDGLGLALHYNRDGWIEYADSDLEKNISVEFEGDSSKLRARIAEQLQSQFIKNSGGDFKKIASWRWEPILWRDEDHPEWLAAFQIEVTFEGPFEIKNVIVEQSSGAILSDYEKIRRMGDSRVTTSVKVYKNSVVVPSPPILSSVSIITDDNSKLKNTLFHVVRDETSSSVTQRIEIAPADYSGSTAFTTDPSQYAPTCVDTNVNCANQAFDGVNIFYHLQNYRGRIDGYLTTLGASPSWPDSPGGKPLTVIINSQFTTFGNGKDNAAYVTSSCGEDIDRCLVFFKPSGAGTTISGCTGTQTIDNLAREALVAVHEYQHYVTDIISGIEFSTTGKTTVGDALHEGYSDYSAASALSDLNSPTDVTLLGVSFPSCSGARREMNVLKVYEESSDSSDPHLSGLTWASALWKLRTILGAATVDKIALKSLYFLGTNPGFVSSVESLVKADRALNNGANVDRIRTLLYTEAKFLGSLDNPFKNPTTMETFVGFKGCGGISLHSKREQSQFSGAIFLVWGLLSLFLGRFLSKRKVA